MHIQVVSIYFHIPYAQSLKDKRRVVKSLKEKTRYHYNISIAETDYQDHLYEGELSFVHIATSRAQLGSLSDKVVNVFEAHSDIEIFDIEKSFI